MYMCLKNNIAMVLESTPGYMCIEKAIAEILVGREPSMCIEQPIEVTTTTPTRRCVDLVCALTTDSVKT